MARKPRAAAKPKTPVGPPWEHQEWSYIAGRAAIDGAEYLGWQAEQKWGQGRLRLLVSEELRAKFDSQRFKFRLAVLHGDLNEVKTEGSRMCNAWRALDKAADAAGCQKLSPVVWEATQPNGRVLAVVQTTEEAIKVAPEGRAIDVITMQEVANLVHGFPELARIREAFPGAEVVAVRPVQDPLQATPWDEDEGDSLEGTFAGG